MYNYRVKTIEKTPEGKLRVIIDALDESGKVVPQQHFSPLTVTSAEALSPPALAAALLQHTGRTVQFDETGNWPDTSSWVARVDSFLTAPERAIEAEKAAKRDAQLQQLEKDKAQRAQFDKERAAGLDPSRIVRPHKGDASKYIFGR